VTLTASLFNIPSVLDIVPNKFNYVKATLSATIVLLLLIGMVLISPYMPTIQDVLRYMVALVVDDRQAKAHHRIRRLFSCLRLVGGSHSSDASDEIKSDGLPVWSTNRPDLDIDAQSPRASDPVNSPEMIETSKRTEFVDPFPSEHIIPSNVVEPWENGSIFEPQQSGSMDDSMGTALSPRSRVDVQRPYSSFEHMSQQSQSDAASLMTISDASSLSWTYDSSPEESDAFHFFDELKATSIDPASSLGQAKDAVVAALIETFLSRTAHDVSSPTDAGNADERHTGSQANRAVSPASSARPSTASAKRRNRVDQANNDSADEDDNDGRRPPVRKRPNITESDLAQKFACPYYKLDIENNTNCAVLKLSRIRDVKNHLIRRHWSAFMCNRCWKNFDCAEARRGHPCEEQDWQAGQDLRPDQRHELSKRREQGTSEQNEWFQIWDICTDKRRPQPASPYNDSGRWGQVAIFMEFLFTHGPTAIDATLTSRNLPIHNDPEYLQDPGSFRRAAIRDALRQFCQDWRDHQAGAQDTRRRLLMTPLPQSVNTQKPDPGPSVPAGSTGSFARGPEVSVAMRPQEPRFTPQTQRPLPFTVDWQQIDQQGSIGWAEEVAMDDERTQREEPLRTNLAGPWLDFVDWNMDETGDRRL
jgi:hypothetical protein